jgi:hypothetical protein
MCECCLVIVVNKLFPSHAYCIFDATTITVGRVFPLMKIIEYDNPKVGCYVDESAGGADCLNRRTIEFAEDYGFVAKVSGCLRIWLVANATTVKAIKRCGLPCLRT